MVQQDDVQQRKTFQLKLKNIFQCIQKVANEEVEEGWKNVKNINNETAETTLGRTKQEHSEWISLDTWRAMGDRSGATIKHEWSTTWLKKQRKQHTKITLELYRESVSICVMVKL